ncbi:T9SS type B sorting domain-containing protein [Polaribacter sp.]|nr:T9SS type B sorting domain-containing protein [Polaribacter sp.]
MMRKTPPLLIILFVLFGYFNKIQAQLSTKHFIPPLTNAEFGSASPENQYFYISTPNVQNVNYTIKQIGLPVTSNINGTVNNTNPQEIFIGTGVTQLFQESTQTSTVTTNKGYIIESDAAIYVSIRVLAGGGAQAGALVSKGNSAPGTSFRAGMFTNENPQTNYLNFISVMATENNTTVNFSDFPAGISIENYTGTTPINVILNEGESYIVATNSDVNTVNRDGLIGTLIVSDIPIVVNTGSANGSFHNGRGRDYGIDQIVGLDKVGSEYIFVKGGGNDNWENVLIVAHEDNTNMLLNGTSLATVLNAGDYYLVEGNRFDANGNLYVETNKKVFAYQGIGANANEANQGLFFVPPLSCENRGEVDNIPMIEKIGTTTFTGGITVVTNKGATVSINGITITDASLNTFGPFDVIGTNYETYKVLDLTGSVAIQGSGELYCAYFNQNGAATSGSFYSGFTAKPEIGFQTTVGSLGNCIPNITLTAENKNSFDRFEWLYDDGTGFVSKGVVLDPTIIPALPGDYQLVSFLDCSGSAYRSVIVPVSVCPDDADGDLVIDNIDIDIDNDGVLNCDESNGDAVLDLSDLSNPNILFLDGTATTSIITSSVNSNLGSISGTNTGNIQTVINPTVGSSLTYELNFTEKVNLKFIQNSATDHTVTSGEFFILKVGPNNKNITLLDPDDQLLVDSNYDGVFETGVTNISSSEIHFRYAASTTGANSTFQFVASRIANVEFRHLNLGMNAPSTFNGNISLTCFFRDSDGDGVEDAFDLDADNDGIRDFYEATGSNAILTNTDTNLDGLDDFFDTLATNLDSDFDGVLNFIDVDADNDGIYDLLEFGLTITQVAALDPDNDGVINMLVDSNNNGLHDNLETLTTADTDADGLPNFIALDADADACFDVIEAGFTDNSNDGLLGGIPLTVAQNGKVTSGTDGYTAPNLNYITAVPILLNTPFVNQTFCELETNTLTIDTNADDFQWQLSIDGGTTWTNIVNDFIYDNSTTTALQITSTPLSFHNNQYRVVLGRSGNTCGLTSTPILLKVDPLPNILFSVELKQCDDDTDGFTDFNLNEAAFDISTNFNNETFVFYPTLPDVENDSNAFTAAEAIVFRNRTVTSDIVWVRAISNFGCYRIAEVNLVVSTTGLPASFQRSFTACDDFLDIDGNDNANNDDTDGVATFDFSSVTPEVVAIFPNTQQLTVTYYRNSADALAEINAIADIANYRNIGYPGTQQIYIRVDSNLDNDCLGFGPFITLNVDQVPITNNLAQPLSLCDDFGSGASDDGENINIDLRQTVNEILGTQTETDFIVTYHTSQADASSGAAPILNDTNFKNTAPLGFVPGTISRQTIFVRVEDRNKVPACFNDHLSFDIEIKPLPGLKNTIDAIEVCDVPTASDSDPRNRVAQNIDATIRNTEILNGRDPNLFAVKYYKSQTEALNDLNSLTVANLLDYENDPANTFFPANVNSDEPGVETLFFTITDLVAECSSGPFTLDIRVYPEPNIPVNINNYTDCDTDNNGLGNDTDGILENIAFSSKISEILANYSTAEYSNFTVTFHENLAEAQTGDTPLDINAYTNLSNNQTIFVRVLNNQTECVNDDLSFDIIVNALPSFDPLDLFQVACLNYLPLTLQVDNPLTGYNYSWVENLSGNEISTSQSVDIRAGGTYTLTVTDRVTLCNRIEMFDVIESEAAIITSEHIAVIDETTEIFGNNSSITIDDTSGILGIGDYEYALLDELGNFVYSYQDTFVFNQLSGGFYTVLVRDKNGCDKNGIIASLEVPVVEFPDFFTPNGDGVNDTWNIKGINSNFYLSTEIYIYNRFGKVVAKVNLSEQGWDGTYNGKRLPSDDYWVSIKLVPFDPTKKTILKTGNFSLLRK